MDLSEKQEEDEIKQFSLEVQKDIKAENSNDYFRQKFEKYEYLITEEKLTKTEQNRINE